jgi:uncharacterized repeat protein (TIGR01451 family)
VEGKGKGRRTYGWRLLGATLVVAAAALPAAAPVGGGTGCPCALFDPSDVPVNLGGVDPHPVELGLRFAVDAPVQLTRIRFYKDPQETGSHVGRIWDEDGAELAQATFSDETVSGWQEATLSSPLLLSPGETYVASVGINEKFVMSHGQLSTVHSSGPLRSLADGHNGVYAPGLGVFPTETFAESNYHVDVVVEQLPAPTATVTPADGATGVASGATVSATFSRAMDAATLTATTFTLATGGTAVDAAVAYDSATKTATLTPASPLAAGTTYTARLSGDVAAEDGVLFTERSWSFTTAAATPPPPPPAAPPEPPAPAPQAPAKPTQADLAVAVQTGASSPTVGSDLAYTVTVTNAGPAAATNVVLTATLAPALAYRSAASAAGGCTESGPVRCVLGTLAPGASVSVTLAVAAHASGEATSLVEVAGDQPDPNPANNRANSSVAVATRVLSVDEARVRITLVRTRTVSGARTARTWVSLTPTGLPFRPARLQLALDPGTPWSWRGFVERFSFRSSQRWIWIRLADGSGTETSWQRIALPRSSSR